MASCPAVPRRISVSGPAFPFPLPAGAVAALPTGQLGDRKLDGRVRQLAYASAKHWTIVIPVEAWSGGIASAILIGAFAGLMPAVRASRPTVALRMV